MFLRTGFWKWTLCVYNVAPLSDEAGNHKLLSRSTFQNKTSVFHANYKEGAGKSETFYILSLNLKQKIEEYKNTGNSL